MNIKNYISVGSTYTQTLDHKLHHFILILWGFLFQFLSFTIFYYYYQKYWIIFFQRPIKFCPGGIPDFGLRHWDRLQHPHDLTQEDKLLGKWMNGWFNLFFKFYLKSSSYPSYKYLILCSSTPFSYSNIFIFYMSARRCKWGHMNRLNPRSKSVLMSASQWGPLERSGMIRRSQRVKITPFMLPHCTTVYETIWSSQALHFSNIYKTMCHVTDIIILKLIDGKIKGNMSSFKNLRDLFWKIIVRWKNFFQKCSKITYPKFYHSKVWVSKIICFWSILCSLRWHLFDQKYDFNIIYVNIF